MNHKKMPPPPSAFLDFLHPSYAINYTTITKYSTIENSEITYPSSRASGFEIVMQPNMDEFPDDTAPDT